MAQTFLLFQLISLIYFFNVHVMAENTDVVETDKGEVRGNVLQTVQLRQRYSAFRGIPYAEPPIGYGRRFRRPVPAKPWCGVLDATKDPSDCAQWDFGWRERDRHIGSEDCLYLSVYTPELNFTNPKPRAVMAYIHGGAFSFGSIHSSKLGPDFLIEKDVVVVVMNYRLGLFGFLSLNSRIVDANNGLKDQAEALRWIQRNIRKFGGDPDKVTIFGESAGAASVEYHKTSPQSKDLFRASIAMSGSALNDWAFYDRKRSDELSLDIVKRFVSEWSSEEDLYRKMIYMNMHTMLMLNKVPYRPTSDSEFFTIADNPDMYNKNRFTAKPHILGFMRNEGVTIAAPFSILTDFVSPLITNVIAKPITDNHFIRGIDLTQRALTVFNDQPIYYYQNSFDYNAALHKVGAMRSKPGAGHGDDIAHIFWVSDQQQSLDPNSDIGKHREKMVTMWTNFAKYLQPILDNKKDPIFDNLKWKRSNQTGGYLDIDDFSVFFDNNRPIPDDMEKENSESPIITAILRARS